MKQGGFITKSTTEQQNSNNWCESTLEQEVEFVSYILNE